MALLGVMWVGTAGAQFEATEESAEETAGGLPPPTPFKVALDEAKVMRRGEVLEVGWEDTEDKIMGTVTPGLPRAGQEMEVRLEVGRFEGKGFEGPVTLTLKPRGAMGGDLRTVKREGKMWRATFVPEEAGTYQLDISYRSSRLKVVHGYFEVGPALVPQMIGWSILGALLLIALVAGVRGVLFPPKEKPVVVEEIEASPAPATGAAAAASEAPAPAEPSPPEAEALPPSGSSSTSST